MSTDRVPFLDAVQDISAGNGKVPKSEFLRYGSLAIVDQGQGLIAGYSNDLNLRVRADDSVIVFGDHTRAFKYVDFPFAMGADGVKVLRAREGFDTKYVYRYLQSRVIPNAGYSRHFKFLREIDVPKPSIDEQLRIAAILDQADTLRGKRRQVLAELDALTQSIFHNMFEGQDWPMMELGSVAEIRLGKMLDAKRQSGANSRRYLRNANVQWFRLELDDLLEMDFDERDRATFQLQPGDVLVCEGGHPGRSAIWQGEISDCYFQKALHRVRLGERLLPEYFIRVMRAFVDRGALKDYVTSATIAHLTGDKFRTLPIPIPPIDLQRTFVQRVQSVRAVYDIADGNPFDELFFSLQDRAFSGGL